MDDPYDHVPRERAIKFKGQPVRDGTGGLAFLDPKLSHQSLALVIPSGNAHGASVSLIMGRNALDLAVG